MTNNRVRQPESCQDLGLYSGVSKKVSFRPDPETSVEVEKSAICN